MKIIKKQLVIFFAIFIICITNSLAHEYKIGNLKILHPYIIETPPGVKTAGGYMKIVNTSNQTDYLSLVIVDFAKASEIHELKMENGVMKMSRIIMRPLARISLCLLPFRKHLLRAKM